MGSKNTSLLYLLQNYPDLTNNKLPLIIGCLEDHDIDEVKQGFQRVCFKDVRIIELKGERSNNPPVCIWRVYYELSHPHHDIEFQHKDIPPNLPDNDQELKTLFENVTMMAAAGLGMKVVRKYIGKNEYTAIVEYSPISCQCTARDFKEATEVPRRWPIKEEIQEVQVRFLAMRM